MTAEFDNKGNYREILKIDFIDNEEYRKFIADLAEAISMDMRFTDELEENIAHEIATRHMPTLAQAVFDKLIIETRNES